MLQPQSEAFSPSTLKMSQTATFPGRFESLSKISQFVVQAARAASLNEDAVYAVDLAVDEACTNIIEHAYGGEGLGEIQCTCTPTPEGLKIVLHDHGRPFNPAKIPPPNTKVRLKNLKHRGAGLYIMQKMMDEVRFEFNEGAGNRLTMVKYRIPKE
jgi:serine/threonine-protein kinase RsbW